MAVISISACDCRCEVCGHSWLASTPPTTCPACASLDWNGNAPLPLRPGGKKYPERTPVGGIITPQ